MCFYCILNKMYLNKVARNIIELYVIKYFKHRMFRVDTILGIYGIFLVFFFKLVLNFILIAFRGKYAQGYVFPLG